MKFRISRPFFVWLLVAACLVEDGLSFVKNPSVLPISKAAISHNKGSPLTSVSSPTSTKSFSSRRRGNLKPLQASPLAVFASSPISALIILAGIVLVHEGGHYLAARGFGIKVEEFSVGIGPKILGFKAFGDEFNLRAFPLGGYVRFPENFDIETVRQKEKDAIDVASKVLSEKIKDPTAKIVNALTLGALADEEIRKENERRKELAAELDKLPWWKKATSKKNVKELAPIVSPDQIEIEYYDDPQLLQNRSWLERAVVLSGGIAFNFLLAFAIYFGIINFGAGLPSPVFDSGIVVAAPPRPDASANGLLRQGDVILEINGNALIASQSPTLSQSQKAISDFIQQIRATPDGQVLNLQVLHSGDSTPVQITVEPKKLPSSDVKTIGVLLSPNFVKSQVLKSDNPLEAAGMAAKYTTDLIVDTTTGLTSIVGNALTGKSAGGQLSGPIGLIKVGSEVVASQDWTSVGLFAAALSVNLGVVNAFPLPALDGGQLMFVFWEAVSKRKVNQRVQEGITGATFFLLLLLSLGAAVGDIENIVLGR